MRRCPVCGEENSDRARFCQACATALDAEPGQTREVRKVVTVLFADVTGSTRLGEQLDPETLRHVMGRFFDTMKSAIERHGGVVEKFIGDAVMAVFGIPHLHEDDPVRAVRAAAAMVEGLERLNADLLAERGVSLAIRTGITTGEVVAGDPTAGQRLVTGDAVNSAARLEQAAQPGEILIGEPTYRLVRDAVEAEPVDPLQVKGKVEPLRAHRLLRVQAGADAHVRRLDSPMVGRDRELHLLNEALDRAVSERTCHLFSLLGPAGVGKSRLVLEFLERASPAATVLRGRCLSYGDGITFYPVAEAIRDAAQVADQDSAEEAKAKIEAAASGVDQPAIVAAGVADLIGLAQASVAVEDAFWAVRTFFESLARDRPLILVFDDIHWAEPAFLDLVEHVADWTRDAAILLLCVARPELLDLRGGWGGGKLNATSILLEPLGSDQCAELIENLLGADGLPPAARSRILEAAEGNPLFVEEMIGMLIDDGLLRRDADGLWMASDEVARVAVPPTIQLLLAARLDRLDADERAVAERASVEGKVFHRGAVIRLSPDGDRPQVRTRLLALARKELIRPDRAQFAGEDAFRFRHLLIRDAAYQGMPKEARAELHLRFAEWLTEQAGDRAPEYEDILGHHLEQAYRYRAELGPVDDDGRRLAERAGAVLASAGRRAFSHDDFHGAKGLLRRAIEILPEGGSGRRELMVLLAEALVEASDFQEAAAVTKDVLEEARRAGDRRIEALASAGHPFLGPAGATGTEQEILDRAKDAMRVLGELGDRRGVMLASRTVGFVSFVLGRVDESADLTRWRLGEARQLGDAHEVRRSVTALGGGLYYGSTPVGEAIEEIESNLASVADSRVATAETSMHLPPLYAMQGRFDEARRTAEEVRSMFEEVGDRFRLATRMFWTGPMRVLAGDLDEAERELRESVAILEGLGDKGFLSTIACDLAEVLAIRGAIDEAERFAEYGRGLGASDDTVTQVEWRMVKAKVHAFRGEPEEAERLAREAVALAEVTDYLDLRARSHVRMAEVLRSVGRFSDWREELELAVLLFERKGNDVMVARSREQLAGPA